MHRAQECRERRHNRAQRQEIKDCQDKAKLGVTADEIVKEWKEDLKNNPIGSFEFTGHTPPSARWTSKN